MITTDGRLTVDTRLVSDGIGCGYCDRYPRPYPYPTTDSRDFGGKYRPAERSKGAVLELYSS